jgi:hypothetical protein
MHGGPVNKLHGIIGEQATPYPWEEFAGPHGPWGPSEDEMLGDLPESRTFAAGDMSQDPQGDRTPYKTHAGPSIVGLEMDRGPEGNARVLRQSAEAHAVKTNAAARGVRTLPPLEDQWNGFWNPVPGDDILPPVPGQVSTVVAGFGVNDRTSNTYAKRNTFGLNMAHRMRRYAAGSIPGNYQWMKPGGRPMVKTTAGPARPASGMGPFQGQDTRQSYGLQGALLMDDATEYVSPPQVRVEPATQQYETPPAIELW